ncbi:thiol:disulfide interchange protein TlpA [Ferirhizobium litorale]|uniref:TlpA family protein disulfide reductase n=1 Tax=Ferirhizobium litorale TaxID=2927786 RepID=A0AAE3QHF9_9HYPH|nr:TlpA disulfide reductase family protein [Fererhizobium litorale]MDI7923555.1 TlpA family protein disulfide reductase [Fererhizobium litorale]
MTERKPLGLPSAKLVAIAALAGVVAGAAAVYVKGTGSGNGGAETAAVSGECAASKDRVAAIAPFARGEVAALAAADQPRRLQMPGFKAADDKEINLDAFAGKAVLVNLWATWCVPCREEMPALNALQQQLGGDKFAVVAINIDTGGDEKPKTFLSETGVDALGFYRDQTMGVFNVLKKEGLAFGLPATFLLDEKGCLIGSMNGPAAWDSDDAKALINAAVEGPEV